MFGKLENGNLTYAPNIYQLEVDGELLSIVNFNKNIELMKKYGFKEVIDIVPSHNEYEEAIVIGYDEDDISITIKYEVRERELQGLEKQFREYAITQNRMQLASTYSADSVTFKVDYFSLCGDEENYDEDLYNLILNNILVGKDNYDYDKMFTMILDYASWNQISWEQFDILVGLMDMQHNPPVEELPTEDEIEEDIIENEETPVE